MKIASLVPSHLSILSWIVCVFGIMSLNEGHSQNAPKPKRLKVITSFLPAYSHTVAIAGELAEVENLLSGSVTPHDFQLSPKEVRRIKTADILVVNGLELEEWVVQLGRKLSTPGALQIVECTAGLDKELIQLGEGSHHHSHGQSSAAKEKSGRPSTESTDSHDHSHFNPHVWLDPKLTLQAVTNILQALSKADPGNIASYRSNADQYIARLQKLDGAIATLLGASKGKSFVTLHDAFAYFGKRYNLGWNGVIEVIPEVSPSPRYLTDLTKRIRSEGVKVIFTEPGNTPRLAKQLAKDLSLKIVELETLEAGTAHPKAYEDGLMRIATTVARELAR